LFAARPSSARCCSAEYRCIHSKASATCRSGTSAPENELAIYAVFGALSVLTVALAMRNDARGLATLLSPAFVLFGAWLLATVVLPFDPVRRSSVFH
jgi:hypothetical protein